MINKALGGEGSSIEFDSQCKKGLNHWELIKYYMEPIEAFFEMDGVTEICVDRYDDIKIEQYGELKATQAKFKDEAQLVSLITQISIMLKQPLNQRHYPILDARLPTGARINATLYPISVQGTSMSIRCFPKCQITPQQLIEFETLTQEMLMYLEICMKARLNIFICGSTGSGKTTLMNALSQFIGEKDRVLIIEDTNELQLKPFSSVFLEAAERRVTEEGASKISMSHLIGVSLRRRPDRIFVGELRFPDAAAAFLAALNTGHRGCMATVHANSCKDALSRFDGLVAANGMHLPFNFIQEQIRSNIDVIIFQEKTALFGRRVTEIVEIDGDHIIPIFGWDYTNGRHLSNVHNSIMGHQFEKYNLDFSMLKQECL